MRKVIPGLFTGRVEIDDDIADRIARVFGTSADVWKKMQENAHLREIVT
jgi:plasmid maintenance system antidote protein VapI